MPLRTILYRSPMLGLARVFSACMGFHRDSAGWQGGSDEAVEKHRRWRKSLPRCFPWKPGLREDWPESGRVEKVRGVLYPGPWYCTLMGCGSDCCNAGGTTLKFIPRVELNKNGARGKGRSILLVGKSYPLGYSARDCEVESLDSMPLLEVVVSGRLDEEDEGTVVDAKMCVLGELPRDSVRVPAVPARP